MRLPQTQNLTDGKIYYIIHNGIWLTGMPAFGTEDEDQDSWKLVHFIRHLPKLTPDELREMQRLNPKRPADRAKEQEEKEVLGCTTSSAGPREKTKKPTTPHDREEPEMKRVLVFLVTFCAVGVLAYAHGGNEHVEGTVTQITENSITIHTAENQSTTITLTVTTKFEKSGADASITDLKAGNRVVIYAKLNGDSLEAATVKFGKPPHAPMKPDERHVLPKLARAANGQLTTGVWR